VRVMRDDEKKDFRDACRDAGIYWDGRLDSSRAYIAERGHHRGFGLTEQDALEDCDKMTALDVRLKAVKQDDPEQSRRFIRDAERLGCDDPDALDRALKSGALKRDQD
ncbi:MAG: hypothetical protein OXI37_02755, partial [Gammaproteobacteria bacterium]|nr:hypothetical protein [Gammaproteobacteria bacterium]